MAGSVSRVITHDLGAVMFAGGASFSCLNEKDECADNLVAVIFAVGPLLFYLEVKGEY